MYSGSRREMKEGCRGCLGTRSAMGTILPRGVGGSFTYSSPARDSRIDEQETHVSASWTSSTMSKNGYGPQMPAPKYLNDFSKALASEVRILLAEVGQLRDERRALQFEIAELMNMKSKHGAGGEYSPDWRPKIEAPPLEAPPLPPAIEDAPPVQARPGWRVVHKRPERRDRAALTKIPPPAPPQASTSPPPEPPRPDLPAWAQWRPNPLLAPTPVNATPSLPTSPPPPSRAGLFGPPTPPPK
ncbi:hypothetical protein D9615_009420 [Tricholomella constricta]|uniref:Uncharacterized protein n=1 Tax=Tricholomella constricta TaxID=117010 RepID=A0A8H5GYS3_9AGAR|nr:hypothetical protein D9615_009420 [Tricholomella constricta]